MKFLQHPRFRHHVSQFGRFAICGTIGAVIDLSIVTFTVHRLGVSPYVAYVPSSLIAASFVFVANKFFTFRNREAAVGNQILKFALVYGVAIVMNICLSSIFFWGLQRFIFPVAMQVYAAVFGKMMAIGVGMIWNYVLSHGFVFKKSEDVDVAIV